MGCSLRVAVLPTLFGSRGAPPLAQKGVEAITLARNSNGVRWRLVPARPARVATTMITACRTHRGCIILGQCYGSPSPLNSCRFA
jgi:hypothetical protein